MKRSELRRKYGSVTKQVLNQVVVDPVRATFRTTHKRPAIHGVANANPSSENSRLTYKPPSDMGDSEAGSNRNEPMPTPGSNSTSHLVVEENLLTAPVLTINPRFIAAIPEEPLLEKVEDEGLQNAVVYQNSKLYKKSEGQWVVEPLF